MQYDLKKLHEVADQSTILQTFENKHPYRDYAINITCPEYTSVCPMTGQPDFGTIYINYVPDRKCLELKSLKMYLFSYRNKGIFYEDVVNKMLNDLVKVLEPRRMEVKGDFTVRGGIKTVVAAEHVKGR
jgi:7-cyano-7-deazaguanine reductase